jgi:hypothetical protein
MSYTNGTTRTTLTGAVGMSGSALLLVTHAYAEAITNKETREAKELQMIRQYKLPLVLLYFDNLTETDVKTADLVFMNMRVIKKWSNVPYEEKACLKFFDTYEEEYRKLLTELTQNG